MSKPIIVQPISNNIITQPSVAKINVFVSGGSTSGGGITGLTPTRIPFSVSASALSDDANLFWDNSNKTLLLGGAISVHPENKILSLVNSSNPTNSFASASFAINQLVANSGGSVEALEGLVDIKHNSGNIGLAIATIGDLFHSGGGILNLGRSLQGGGLLSSSGSITEMMPLFSTFTISGTGSIGTYYGLYIDSLSIGAGSVGTNYGVYQLDPNATNKFFGKINTTGSTTTSPINIGSVAGDPSSPSNGDLVYNTSLSSLRARISGAWVSLSTGTIALTNSHIYVGNASNIAIDVAMSGDASINNTGAVSVISILGNTIPTNALGALTNNGTGILSWTPYLTPFGSQTNNFFYAAPNGSSGTPSFRAIVVADIPTLNQNTTGSAAKWTTAITLAGNSVDGSANVAFANKFIVQGTVDAGLSAAQFLGALGTGIVKNTTSTGIFSIAIAADFPTLNQSTTGSAATLTTGRTISITGDLVYTSSSFDGSGNVTAVGTLATVNANTGSFGSSTAIPNFTVNGKGLITAAGTNAVIAPAGTLSGTTLNATVVTSSLTSVGTLGGLTVTAAPTFSAMTSSSVLFAGASGLLSQDNNNFYWNIASHILSVNTSGDQGGTDSINAYNQIDAYLPNSSQGAITSSGATSGFTASSSRGTGASPINLNAGDLVGGFSMWGYTNSAYTPSAGAWSYMSGSTSANLGGEYRIYTKADGGALTQRFTIDNAGGIQRISANASSTWANTWTTTANSQIGRSYTSTIIQRATASDDYIDNYFNPSITLGSTTQNPVGFNIDVTYIQTGGVSTTTPNTSTTTGMTATTYNSIAPASTSGSGSGALFTVIVGSATVLISITQTTPGSGYKVNDTITFNGSQFGSGSGSAIFIVRQVSGVSLGTNASPLRIGIKGENFLNNPKLIDFWYSGASNFNIGYLNATPGGQSLSFNDPTSTNFYINNLAGAVFNKAVTIAGTLTANGALNINNGGTFLGVIAFNSAGTGNNINIVSSVTAATNGLVTTTGSLGGATSTNQTFSTYKLSNTITVGIINTFTFGGTATTGVYNNVAATGGSGTGATFNITVTGGSVTGVIIATRGKNYVATDALTCTVTGGSATITVSTVDFTGTIITGFHNNSTYTDKSSAYTFIDFYANSTLNQTSSASGPYYGFRFNPTITAALGPIYGFVSNYTAALNGVGGTPIGASWSIIGNGSNITLKTVGAGTTTNYSIRSFQSDGTTEILSLLDNGALKLTGNFTLGTSGNRIFITEGSNGVVGQVALVAGTKAITISGLTTSSRAFRTLVSQGGTVSTTVDYECVCTTNTLTINAVTNAGSNTLNILDTSTINYFIIN